MNVINATKSGLAAIIEELQQQKDELVVLYNNAISNGEKLQEVKTMYITIKDVDKRLSELMRVC